MTSGTTSSTQIFTLHKSKKEKKGAENAFKDIMAENFPNLGKEKDIQAHKVQRVPNKINPKRSTSSMCVLSHSVMSDSLQLHGL